MKKVGRFVAVWVILFSLVLASCAAGGGNGRSNPMGEKTCQEGICVSFAISEPIVLNQPSEVTITVEPTVDKAGLLVVFQADKLGIISEWHYDAVANQTEIFHSTMTFGSEGFYAVVVMIGEIGGPIVSNEKDVLIDSHGAVINPTINPNPTSDLFIASTPPPRDLTATAEAEPTLPPVEGFTPQEWLQKCG